jgi:hypothetical protein
VDKAIKMTSRIKKNNSFISDTKINSLVFVDDQVMLVDNGNDPQGYIYKLKESLH